MVRSGLQRIRRLIDRAGNNIYPKADHFVSDQVDLLGGASAPVIFDVGANEGKFAQTYRQHFPDARIFCLEPIPHVAARLRAGQPSADVIESALASEDSTASFFVNAFEDTSSSLQSDLRSMPQSYRPMMQPKDSIKVRTAKLDTLMGQFSLDTINTLKMDIQGGEYNALKGASQALERKRASRSSRSKCFWKPTTRISACLGRLPRCWRNMATVCTGSTISIPAERARARNRPTRSLYRMTARLLHRNPAEDRALRTA